MIRISKCLHNAVVCNGNGLVSPVMCPFYNIRNLRNSVHITHLGMAVKLHSFLRIGILSGHGKICNFTDSCHRADRKLPVKLINRGNALDL